MTAPRRSPQELLRAALEGDLSRLRALLDAGASPEADSEEATDMLRRAENDNSPHAAFRKGLLETLVLHQQHGRINAALYLAAYNGFDGIVDHFLEKSAEDPLALNVAAFAALRAGRAPLAEKLLDAGADPCFKKDLHLRAAIDADSAACVQLLLSRGAPRAEGLAHAAARGQVVMAGALLRREDDIRPPLEKICHALSDNRALPDKLRIADVEAAADMLLALAAARGDDMQQELIRLSFAIAREGAAAMVQTVLRQDAFAALDAQTKRNLFDVLTPVVFSGMQKLTHADADKTLNALIDAGGAQSVLEGAAAAGNSAFAVKAIRAGGDPRKNGGRALRLATFMHDNAPTAATAQILQDMQLATAALGVRDESRSAKILNAPAADIENLLRKTDARGGVTGLMALFAAGKGGLLPALADKASLRLTAADFTACDAQGYTALERMADTGAEDLLFLPALWQGRKDAYLALWEELDEDRRLRHAAAHDTCIAALDNAAQQQILHDSASRHDFRLPHRRKSGPRGDKP